MVFRLTRSIQWLSYGLSASLLRVCVKVRNLVLSAACGVVDPLRGVAW